MYRFLGLGAKAEKGAVAAGAVSGAEAGAAVGGGWGAVIGGAVGAGSAFLGPGGSGGPTQAQLDQTARQLKLKMQQEDAAARIAASQSERNQIIKYSLFGLAGLLLVGAGTLWILSRKKAA